MSDSYYYRDVICVRRGYELTHVLLVFFFRFFSLLWESKIVHFHFKNCIYSWIGKLNANERKTLLEKISLLDAVWLMRKIEYWYTRILLIYRIWSGLLIFSRLNFISSNSQDIQYLLCIVYLKPVWPTQRFNDIMPNMIEFNLLMTNFYKPDKF